MTREEEITQAMLEHSEKEYSCEENTYFVMGAEWADSHPHWISVEDELPKIGKDVLILRQDGEMRVAHQYNEELTRWWSVDGYPLNNNTTHWMPLPQPSKEGGQTL